MLLPSRRQDLVTRHRMDRAQVQASSAVPARRLDFAAPPAAGAATRQPIAEVGVKPSLALVRKKET